jgi:hypothetical protein
MFCGTNKMGHRLNSDHRQSVNPTEKKMKELAHLTCVPLMTSRTDQNWSSESCRSDDPSWDISRVHFSGI